MRHDAPIVFDEALGPGESRTISMRATTPLVVWGVGVSCDRLTSIEIGSSLFQPSRVVPSWVGASVGMLRFAEPLVMQPGESLALSVMNSSKESQHVVVQVQRVVT